MSARRRLDRALVLNAGSSSLKWSVLDVHTEALVEEALRRVLAGVTALVVVHRPSTVALADRVALLDGGRITHVGTHTELLAISPTSRAILSQEADEAQPRERAS